MKFVVSLTVDGTGRRVGGMAAGKYIRIYEADRFHLLIKLLQNEGVFADDIDEITIQSATDYTNR